MSESLITLRKRRGFRKGQLTKLKRILDDTVSKDLREQDLDDLISIETAIEEESSCHLDLQTKVEELLAEEEEEDDKQDPSKDTAFTKELESGAEFKKLYQGYLTSISNLIRDFKLYQEAEELEGACLDWTSTADPTSRTFTDEGREFIGKLDGYLSRTTHKHSNELFKCCRTQLQTQRGAVRRLMNELKEKKEEPKMIPIVPESHSGYRSKFDIELPSFNGNPKDWSSYFELFSTTIEKRGKHLTQEERSCLLLKSLKDQEAKELAQLNTTGKDGFDRALQALKQRYGHSQVILPLHVSTLLSSQTYGFDRDSMLQLGKTFVITHESLVSMKVDLSTFLTAVAASRFQPKLAEEWSKYTTTLSDLPTMDDLNAYLQSMVCRLPTTPAPSLFVPSHNNVKPKGKTIKTESSSGPGTSCILCSSGTHSLSKCSVFKGYNSEKRNKFVREKRWCVNCLHHSHTSQHCSSVFNCRQCNGRHHTLLHRDSPSTEQPPSTTTNNNANTCVAPMKTSIRSAQPKRSSSGSPILSFLSTAMVNAIHGDRQRTSRLALDSGSSTSLITESLASHLKLRRFPQRLNISGAYGDGSSKSFVEAQLQSRFNPEKSITLKLSVVKRLPTATPPSVTSHILSDKEVKDLQLADKQFGGKLDILLGTCDVHTCIQGHFNHIPDRGLTLTPTIFGWTVSGPLQPGQATKFLSLQTTTDDLHQSLQKIWELDRIPETTQHSSRDESALQQFQDQVQITSSGRYSVSLPRIQPTPTLGASKTLALKRFESNERSLVKKGKLDAFNTSLREYEDLDHAEQLSPEEINKPSYYLPIHGVFKETSTTTKARPVFDASAKSSNGVALNDLLLAGPNLYPLLTDLLIQFRVKKIAFSADISKMFREILLNESERDLHRFIMRDSNGQVRDYKMKRLTFGVKSSPFLATKVLHHLAETHSNSHPSASNAILRFFYVDDFLSGADTMEEATHLREQLCDLLQLAGMNLRKWRTSSTAFANTIPDDLLEKQPLDISDAPKALGIHWDTGQDTLQISTPDPSTQKVTKRNIASKAAQVYDLLGLFSPYAIRSKILLQEAWRLNHDWDEEVSTQLSVKWQEWTSELPLIHQHAIPRRYNAKNDSPVLQKSLHGFSDASNLAYGAVIYLRQCHADGSTSISLVMSKARVAPLKAITIPRAELNAAHLLAKLLVYVAKLLDISSIDIHAWTDSMIVLCWIRKSPASLQTFVANRISQIQTLLPDITWRHIPTKENPADLLSRGVSAATLLSSSLWWVGPPWLPQTPANWSPQQQLAAALPKNPPEIKTVILTASIQPVQVELWDRYSSFKRLTRITTWIRRFLGNLKASKKQLSPHLQSEEIQSARNFLLHTSQLQAYPEIPQLLKKNKRLPSNHPLAKFNVNINNNNLILVSGRVRQPGSREPKRVIALSLRSPLAKLFISTEHRINNHPGVSALMAIITENFFIAGLKSHLKHLSRACSICQRAYAKTLQPSMGLLPSSRTSPTPPFQITGLDLAGPFHIKKGHTRRPVILKTYLCLFVCFTTRAIHLELCGDLSTEEFIAALRRFCSRRGTPTEIHSDNGTNFVGAAKDMKQTQHLVNSSRTAISHFATTTNITWHFIPPRAPNFGGLWEAGVKQAKLLLKKVVTPHPLLYEELYTVLTEVEAILNSRPIVPLDSTELDEDLVLTPGHFLIGRPLKAAARQQASEAKMTSLKRWSLVQRMQQDLWTSWQTWYINQMYTRAKWRKSSRAININDIVLVKDETLATPLSWPLARVTQVYKGDDGVIRAVDLRCKGNTYRRATNRLVPITN